MRIIDRKFKFIAVSIRSGKEYTEKDAILLDAYIGLCAKAQVDERQLKGVQLLKCVALM